MKTDNSRNRLHEVFFYGLYIDPKLLEKAGVNARNPRVARVENFVLRIGNKATLLRAPGEVVHGFIYSLTYDEINTLYWGAGLYDYIAESLIAKTTSGSVAVLCCNLLDPPNDNESNPDYLSKLEELKSHLGLPL